ncbi:ATP-binding protein [Wohlfahrtiimonas chitiniclastica]|uniref:ATP-binding protein n=1 Tax=Wohlfahrtiimonas chitiniclastica TaxID=400946 RepID=UPI001BCDDCD4|nr:ATP-binding protein [Wohlfahrtiimonas chitiniclastica]MBS7838038.1 ATP-binding protein [Wohlfahrtiimonas chitiniclastica]
MMQFNEYVKINENFKKSTNLQLDHGNLGFLEGYILSPSNQENLERIINSVQNQQSAFTFTGPYGSGKSSFALFLSELLAPSSQEAYQICFDKITNDDIKQISMLSSNSKREQLTITASPESLLILLSSKLDCDANSDSIISTLEKRMKKNSGIILIIDEMGKLLERTAQHQPQDIYILQQIAELANSSKGRLIFIGILHQSFVEYANNLNKTAQDEWYKIHGRFSDLVIDTSNEEKLDLIGRTIISDKKPTKTSDLLTCTIKTIATNRPITLNHYESLLKQCWPLNPIVALLLGPLSLKNFGQNQRSIFSFLNSEEPNSFQQFLHNTEYSEDTTYSIDMFWSYIQSNFDFILSRSTDARRWLLAQESLDKLYAQATVSKINIELASSILKLIALLEIFKSNSGLVASLELMHHLFASQSTQIDEVMHQLSELSIVREAYDKSGFVLFDGSDFDIDHALDNALEQVVDIDYGRLNKIASFQPIVAKKNYHETGTIRWMNISVMPFKLWKDDPTALSHNFNNSMFGAWLILIPSNTTEYEEALEILNTRTDYNPQKPIILGVTQRYQEINDYARDLLALEWIEKNTASLMGDRFARHEIDNRKSHVSLSINQIINDVKQEIEWSSNHNDSIVHGRLNTVLLNKKCSELAQIVFNQSPILQTEMLNNNKPSGNANGAANALLRRMVLNRGEKRLGIPDDIYPAEWGLFNIVLEKTGIYHPDAEGKYYAFSDPLTDEQKLKTLWDETEKFLKSQDKCTLKDIYNFWSQPSFGIKKGLHSVLFLTYLLCREGNLAAYLQGMYLPEINELFVDYLIKESNEIEIKYIEMSDNRIEYVQQLHTILGKEFKQFRYTKPNILDISRKLVAFINGLNPWVLRTKNLKKTTMRFRDLLKNASDPNKLIFEDIVKLFSIPVDELQANSLQPIIDALNDLQGAYPSLIDKLGNTLYSALQLNPLIAEDLESLKKRADSVNHASGDFRIDALSTRLQTLNVENDSDIAGIASLAANKPIHDWIDLDVDRAMMEIGSLCDGFKKAELYTHFKGKQSNRKSFVVLSSTNGQDVQKNLDFSLPENEIKAIDTVKEQLHEYILKNMNVSNHDVLKMALIELGIEFADKK